MKNNTNLAIPVFIDSVKDSKDFENTRCIYYRVEFDDRLFKVSQKFLPGNLEVMGTWSILTKPFKKRDRRKFFYSKELITGTLKKIEDDDRYFLEIGNIWIPNFLVLQNKKKEDIKQGDVCRISKELFNLCYGFVAGFIKESEWIENCRKHMNDISFSDKETEAFREWRKEKIDESKTRYHLKPKNKQLQKKKSKK